MTFELMRKSFVTFGLPEVIVSDNATNYKSEEFHDFMMNDGIKHIFTPPYHSTSNGLAEQAVQTFRERMKTSR